MNNKGITLSLDRTDVDRIPLSRNQLLILVLGVAAVLVVTATIFFSVSAAKSNSFPEMAGVGEVDTARWVAMGEYYAAEALKAERSATANTARWVAMGEHYAVDAFDAERSAAANTARWIAMGEHYGKNAFDTQRSEAANTARWNALGAHYATDNSTAAEAFTARYEAMAKWYTR